ncbi:MAG TPA: hypothetical protein VGC61_08970 [Pyrinomonadaceae bacterium]
MPLIRRREQTMKAITIFKRNERQRSIPSETLPEPKSSTRKERELIQTVLSWVNERRESSRVNSNNFSRRD